MAVRKFKPVTPGQRHKVIGTFEEITASVPEKSLVFGKRSTGGRNNTGKMTVRYMGGGHKKKYRLIDFKREKDGVPAVVKTIEYDPNRSARIALLFYADGEKRYIIAPNGLEVGAKLMSGAEAAPEVGNALPLANIPVGTVIHNIELRPGQGALLVRSAGNFAQLTSREGSYCVIKLPSGETRKILSACKATVGSVGNSDHALEQSGKAGRSRWLGRRPHNRGVVMNLLITQWVVAKAVSLVDIHVHARACMLRVSRHVHLRSSLTSISSKELTNKTRVNYESFIKKRSIYQRVA